MATVDGVCSCEKGDKGERVTYYWYFYISAIQKVYGQIRYNLVLLLWEKVLVIKREPEHGHTWYKNRKNVAQKLKSGKTKDEKIES